jgi:hypothetical protein
MLRLIAVLLAVALVGMLALRQLEDASEGVTDAAEEAGIAVEAEQPRAAARAVGRAVDATVAAGKGRIDAALEGRGESQKDAR